MAEIKNGAFDVGSISELEAVMDAQPIEGLSAAASRHRDDANIAQTPSALQV